MKQMASLKAVPKRMMAERGIAYSELYRVCFSKFLI